MPPVACEEGEDLITVALVGADGAGKTTVARRVADRSSGSMRYVYMGSNTEANRYALPTSRLVLFLKRRRTARRLALGADEYVDVDLGHVRAWQNPVADVLGLFNRFAEEWVRQLVVWRLRRSGTVVISDRHFVLDFALDLLMGAPNSGSLTERIHRNSLARFYPRPELVIFLDAPAELLHARKRDASMEYLERKQDGYRQASRQLPGFRTIDATGNIDEVVESVEREIAYFLATAPSSMNDRNVP